MEWIGVWENQNGSQLTINCIVATQFEGSFESKKGRAAEDQKYPVQGTINDELIGFVVDFGTIHSLVNFSGRLTEDGAIHTLWVLAREFADDAKTKKTQAWNCFTVNSDVIRKIA